jgi:pimeloyl-ACP methyl ester carboxylesterase
LSTQKSTIDRLEHVVPPGAPRVATPAPRGLAVAPAPVRAPTVATSRALRLTFALLERRSPGLGGALAERLWFRLPPKPDAAVRGRRTPSGGEAFEVAWRGGVVRGRVYGEWGRPTAYLVHGWGGWWQQLGAHVEPLVRSGLCVVAFDGPSHGDSGPGPRGPRSTTFVEMARALAAVVDEFGRPTVVIAHSAGGLATLHALGLGVRPEALVLIAPPRSVEPMVALFTSVLGVGPRSAAAMVRRAERRVGLPVAALDLVRMAAAHATLPDLLVVADRDDPEAPVGGAVELVDSWHDARLLLTQGLGHRRVMWEPGVVERVRGFVAGAAERVVRTPSR